MSILNDKLEKIISESGLYFFKDEVENELNVADRLVSIAKGVKIIWDALPDDKRIAVYGAGYDAGHLFDGEADVTTKNLICVIDNNPEIKEFHGYPVIRNEDIPKAGIDIVLVMSNVYGAEMKSAVKAVSDCEVTDMWEELHKKLYVFGEDAAGFMAMKKRLCGKLTLNEARHIYSDGHDRKYLLYVIHSYLAHRDIKNALIYMDMYIECDFIDADRVVNLKKRLNELLEEIRDVLASKPIGDGLMIFTDSGEAKYINAAATPFLFKLGNENILCTNAYTHMSWTTTSIASIFKQKSFIDNHLYNDVKLNGDEPFFKYLSENNLGFKYFFPFDKSVLDGISEAVEQNQNGCAGIIWDYICTAFENEKSGVYVLHFAETHYPFLCLSHSGRVTLSIRRDSTTTDCYKYVDTQMEFLFNLLPTHTKLLFCADHSWNGQIKITPLNERYNIPYIIYDGITHTGIDKRLVTHLDTVDILINLINNRPAFDGITEHSLIEINAEFYYSEKFFRQHATHLKKGRAYKLFMSNYDKYIIYYDGEEGYFLHSDEETNLIGNSKYIDRINWFRENVNTEFPDWSDDNGRYDIARKYYNIDKKLPQ